MNVPVTPKVAVGPSTIVGYGLSVLGLMTGVIADLTEHAGVFGIDNKWLVLVSTAVAVLTNLGRQIQAIVTPQVVQPIVVESVPSKPVATPTIPQV